MSERESWPPPSTPPPPPPPPSEGAGLPRYPGSTTPPASPYAGARYELPTFDGPVAPFGAPLAGWWQRVGALFLDSVILGIPWFIVNFALTEAFGHPKRITLSNGTHATTKTIGGWMWLLYLAWAILSALYFAYFNGNRSGQTPGNRAPGIAVRDFQSGEAIGWRRGLIRFATRFVLYLVFVVPGVVNDLYPLWDRNRQTLADKAARSVMVRV